MLARRFLVRFVSEVVRNNQRGHAAFRFRHAHGAVDQVTDLGGRAGLLHERARHVLEHADQVDFLLIVAAERRTGLLPGNRKDRNVIHPRVVHAGDQMRCTGARGGDANAKLAGELGIGRRHERSHFLMARLNELDLVCPEAGKATQQPVDAVAGVAEYPPDTPLMQALPKEIADRLRHLDPPWSIIRQLDSRALVAACPASSSGPTDQQHPV